MFKVTAPRYIWWDDISGKEEGNMVDIKIVDAQLERVGMKNKFFGRPEVRELCHILSPNETIQHAVNGQYEGGFAMMLATDRRILLIDKKPWFLTMEDVRYDMVQEVDYYARLLDATVTLITFSKQLSFRSWRQKPLREMVRYIQHRVMQLRQTEDISQNSHQSQATFSQALAQPVQKPQEDFAATYQKHIQRHSLAHAAGQVAMGVAHRTKPIIKPLYPRPSLVTKYRQGTFAKAPHIQTQSSQV